MADATTTTGNKTVLNSIKKMLGRGCTTEQASNYTSIVRMAECGKECFTSLACGVNIEIPQLFNYETIELTQSENCSISDLMAGGGTRTQKYTLSKVNKPDAIDIELYFTPDRLKELVKWGKSQQERLIVIDMTNASRTQIAFWALLPMAGITIPDKSSTDLVVMPITLQPNDEIKCFQGEDINECKV